jgi:polyisoprenoid-binding protein YceI
MRRAVATFACVASFAMLVPMTTLATEPASLASRTITRAIVPAHSLASFDVTHLFVRHVLGKVPIVAGHVTFSGVDATVPSSVEATLDPRRIATGDGDRDDDLQGPDWFDVARFKTWTFASTGIATTPTGFKIDGTLTVHGVAQPVVLDVIEVRAGPHARYRATGTLDRHGFGMHVTPFDGTIGNSLALVLDVELE